MTCDQCDKESRKLKSGDEVQTPAGIGTVVAIRKGRVAVRHLLCFDRKELARIDEGEGDDQS